LVLVAEEAEDDDGVLVAVLLGLTEPETTMLCAAFVDLFDNRGWSPD
jgi:hypothetical protein